MGPSAMQLPSAGHEIAATKIFASHIHTYARGRDLWSSLQLAVNQRKMPLQLPLRQLQIATVSKYSYSIDACKFHAHHPQRCPKIEKRQWANTCAVPNFRVSRQVRAAIWIFIIFAPFAVFAWHSHRSTCHKAAAEQNCPSFFYSVSVVFSLYFFVDTFS